MTPALPLVIVGAGPCGVSAAVEAARLGFPPVVLDRTGEAGGLIRHAFEVRNFPGGPVSGREIAGLFASQLIQWGIAVLGCEIVSVDHGIGSVLLTDSAGGVIEAAAAIVATGTEPVPPSIEGLPQVPGGSLHTDASSVLAVIGNRKVAVIGGSDAAFDQARLLVHTGVAAVVICRSERPKAPPWLVAAALGEGVGLVTGAVVAEARPLRGGVLVEIERSRTSEEAGFEASVDGSAWFDALLAATGRRPVLPVLTPPGGTDRVVVAGDALGRTGRYLCAAMSDGCLAARRLLGPDASVGGES